MKKSGKRVFSLVLTLILAFALAVPAFAADVTDVTIESDHNKNATYEAYMLMTLTTSLKCGETEVPHTDVCYQDDGSLSCTDPTHHVHDEECYNYSYKINSKYEDILKEVLNKNGADEGKTLDQTIMDAIAEKKEAEEVRGLAEDLYDKIKEKEPPLSCDATLDQGTPKDLAQGYWLIVDSTLPEDLTGGVTRSLVMLDTAGAEEITIKAKDDTIDIGKTVTTPDVNLTPEISAEYGTVNIGDTITFTLTSSLPADLDKYTHPEEKYQFKFVDTMSAGLEFIAITSVKIGKDIVPPYEAEDTAQSTPEVPGYQTSGFFDGKTAKNGRGEIDLSTYVQANLDTLGGQTVVVEYTAKLTEDAVLEDNGTIKEENKVYVEFTNDYDTFQKGNTPEKDVDVYSFTLDIYKYTDDNGESGYQEGDTHLADAQFQLYKTVGTTTYYAKANLVAGGEGGNYKITGWAEMTGDKVPTEAATFITPESGKLDIDGLDLGTYYLLETKAPDGYNLLAEPIEITIEDTAGDDATTPTVKIPVEHVENSSGVELPSTGGIGTTIFYTLGGLLAVGAAVFLVTKKRMSGVEE